MQAGVVSPEALHGGGAPAYPSYTRLGLYGLGDLLASQVLPDLRLTVDDIFPEFDFARSRGSG